MSAAPRSSTRDEWGATLVEWALIAAVVMVAASIVAAVVLRIIDARTGGPVDCASDPASTECSP